MFHPFFITFFTLPQVFRGLLAYGEKLRKALLDEPGLEPLRPKGPLTWNGQQKRINR